MLDKIKILGVTCRGTTDNIINFNVILLLAKPSTIHSIGKLNEDRILLHDALNVLTTDTNNALVVLIRHMEGNSSWHLLFDKVETVLCGLVLCAAYYNVEVVLIEAVKDDLHAAVAHDLVDLAVFLTADEFFVLIGELDLDTHVILRLLHKRDVADHHQRSPHSIIRSVDVKVELFKADLST